MKKHPLVVSAILFSVSLLAQENKLNLLIGTYTNKCDSKGVYVYEFDTNTAEFSKKSESVATDSPSYLAVSPDHRFVYTVNSNAQNSAVTAFGFDSKTGQLNFLNKENTNGVNPCFIINDYKIKNITIVVMYN